MRRYLQRCVDFSLSPEEVCWIWRTSNCFVLTTEDLPKYDLQFLED